MDDKIKNTSKPGVAYYHLPGLFEFYGLYRMFLPLFYHHREYFYNWCAIGSIYGALGDCIWGGGRTSFGVQDPEDVMDLMREYGISARLTFSNSLLREEHLADIKCNALCKLFENRDDFRYVVPDFRLNKEFEQLNNLPQHQKDKVEFLCNECCWFGCKDRKRCYENVSRKNLGETCPDHRCAAPGAQEGYRFSKAMDNPGFIGIQDIQNIYLPMGFSNFKIEGRGLGSALILEFLLYYMTKPEYQLRVREEIYLNNMLDLF